MVKGPTRLRQFLFLRRFDIRITGDKGYEDIWTESSRRSQVNIYISGGKD